MKTIKAFFYGAYSIIRYIIGAICFWIKDSK